MATKNTITIFHIYRSNRESLFLHPFKGESKLIDQLENTEIRGRYGEEPRIESFTLFRNELYRIIENSVREWVTEIRFIPRFLISAGLFLLSYFFMTFVIRDPIPMIDEIIISFIIALVVYFALGKKYMQSDVALKKRINLRTKVDRIVFTESEFVKKIESLLHMREELSSDEIIKELTDIARETSIQGESNEAEELVGYLEIMFPKEDFRKKFNSFNKIKSSRELDRFKTSLSHWVKVKKIDLPLFSLYVDLKKEIVKTE